MSLIVVEAIRGRCASFMILTGDIWWTDKLINFSSIDGKVCVKTILKLDVTIAGLPACHFQAAQRGGLVHRSVAQKWLKVFWPFQHIVCTHLTGG